MSSVVRLSSVHHAYNGTAALDGITLELPSGCMAGVIGPDGVGKSTLLGLVAGAVKIQAGSVQVLGGDMARGRHRRKVMPRIAYMPQGLGKNLYASLSVFENLDFFGRLFGLPRAERARRIEDLLKATGLDPFPDRPAGKLSGGMKQKLGLCCALIHDPDLLILDEPTTGVDPLSRLQFWDLIARIRRQRPEMSVLVATAYMEEAEDFDRLFAMNDGKMLAEGTPDEIKTQTGAEDLEQAFVALLPEAVRRGHEALNVPPRPEGEGEIAIEARGLTRRFGDFTAVDHADFRIERGEIFGFVGPNGCGKTTTMKMLTGLLPPSEGSARLFGEAVDGRNLENRKRVGFMSQSFSLYTELTVRQNLDLHARLFHLAPERMEARIAELVRRFDLENYAEELAEKLPLGVRQRLSLAVAVVHAPEILILDEPTSGVDPVARNRFWEILVDLSRNEGVTIFISTHFMNEAERCDRLSFMDAGRVLAVETPAALMKRQGAESLEDAFIGYLKEVRPSLSEGDGQLQHDVSAGEERQAGRRENAFTRSRRRFTAYAYREAMELWRDPIRLTVAFLGTAILMVVLAYGISTDVEDLRYAVLDNDRTPESRTYLEGYGGSRYFLEQAPLASHAELDARLKSNDIALAIEIPPGFGKDLRRGHQTEVSVWVDGAMPFRGETIGGYVQGLHLTYLADMSRRVYGQELRFGSADIEMRYRYNQDFRSVYAMVPAMVPFLLLFIPAILMALSVVREKELGTITNFYVTPVTRMEFLAGKQVVYIAISMINFVILFLMAVFIFAIPMKGNFTGLALSALVYVTATTGIGFLVSSFTRTQIAALVAVGVLTMTPTLHFSGMLQPVATLEGAGRVIGDLWPASYFVKVSVGAFTKALDFGQLLPHTALLSLFVPVLTALSLIFLKKQGR